MSALLNLTKAVLSLGAFLPAIAHAQLIGGGNFKTPNAHVDRGGAFKGSNTLAIGSFRVAFKTKDTVVSTAGGILNHGNGSSVTSDATLDGVEQPLMQKLADAIYADFLSQAATKGFTVIDSAKLASTSSEYAALPRTDNFFAGRFGTFVIPTGQRSAVLAADDFKQDNHGNKGFLGGFKQVGENMASAASYKVFPKVSAQVGAPVIAVTVVVNFAAFKGSTSAWMSHSKTEIATGATIEGQGTKDDSPATTLMAWDSKSKDCGQCMAQIALYGQVHSEESIGSTSKRNAQSGGERAGNAVAGLLGGSNDKHMAYAITVDPAAYEKNVLAVSKEANDILLAAVAKEK